MINITYEILEKDYEKHLNLLDDTFHIVPIF